MVARRDKPALFELVKKGPIKPDSHGSLQTPRWFYGGSTEVPASPGKKAVEPGQPAPLKSRSALSQRLDQVIEHLHHHRSAAGSALPLAGRRAGKSRRLTIVAPWWATILAALALCLIVLVAFQMGQSSGFSKGKQQASMALSTETEQQAPERSDDSLESIRNSEGRTDLIPPSPPPVNRKDSSKKDLSTATVAENTGLQATTTKTLLPTGNCLVLCGHPSWRELRDVQEFFTKNGVPTRIGRHGNRYVLFSEAAFDAPNGDNQARQLKEKVAQLGKRYNQEKPTNAARYDPETFAGAFWVKTDNISLID